MMRLGIFATVTAGHPTADVPFGRRTAAQAIEQQHVQSRAKCSGSIAKPAMASQACKHLGAQGGRGASPPEDPSSASAHPAVDC